MVSHELQQALGEVKTDVDLLKARSANDQNQVPVLPIHPCCGTGLVMSMFSFLLLKTTVVFYILILKKITYTVLQGSVERFCFVFCIAYSKKIRTENSGILYVYSRRREPYGLYS
jgi:hypothetical protein